MMSVRLWAFVSLIATVTANGTSKTLLDFFTYYNGYWNNKLQLEEGGQDHDYIQAWATPLDLPALSSNPVMLVEEINNGVVRILNLGLVSEGREENSVILKLYNFTDVSKVKPQAYDTESLKTLTMNDLDSEDSCVAMFHNIPGALTSGNYQDCRYSINRVHPRYSLTFDCNNAVASVPSGTDQKMATGPYVFDHIGPRHPIPNAPADYVSPCDQ